MDDKKLSVFNYSRNREKLLTNLINLIEGIICDGEVDTRELVFLDTWLLESEIICENYCVDAIRTKIASILEDGVIEKEELAQFKIDLINIQQNLLDTPDIDLYSSESDQHLLEGLCKGMLANHQLVESEVRYLDWWLSQNGMLKNNYPGKELYKLVKDILADGIITPDESETLKQALIDFTGCDIANGVVDGMATRLPIEHVDNIDLQDSVVCLTGKFLCGSRNKCKTEIEAAGGIVVDTITQKIDYLIIGALSSRDWRFQSYGRKIELAINYRDEKGIPLKIISEEQWKSFAV